MSTNGFSTATTLEQKDLDDLNRSQMAGQLAKERVERLRAQLQLAELALKETEGQITAFNNKVSQKYGLQNGDSMDLTTGALTRQSAPAAAVVDPQPETCPS